MPAERPTVLVVDDEPIIRRVLTMGLSRRFRVLTAASMTEALRRIGCEDVHLVLTDVWMPGGTGFDLARALRGSHPGLPVFFISGDVDGKTEREAATLGAPLFSRSLCLDELTRLLEERITA